MATKKERIEEARWLSQPTTPMSERTLASRGLMLFLMPSRGLCPQGRCFRKTGHAGSCYPNN